MRQIIHTCLLAIRLISSTAGHAAIGLTYIGTFDSSLLNAAFGHVYTDPGVVKKDEHPCYHLYPVDVIM